MSRRYATAVVSILKLTTSPLLKLMSVAKPWMLEFPAPLTSHSLAGLPGFEFSQAIGLTIGGVQDPALPPSVIVAVTCWVPDSFALGTVLMSTMIVSLPSLTESCTAVRVIWPVRLPAGMVIEVPERV